MRIMRLPAMTVRARSVWILVAVCPLAMGLNSYGICVEPDGASHVASSGHLCCDPPPTSQGVPGVAFDEEGLASLHDCVHVALLQSTITSARPDHGTNSPVLLHCLRFQSDLPAVERVFDLDGLLDFSKSTSLSTVRLRL